MLGGKIRSEADLKNTLKLVLQDELGFNFDNSEGVKIKTLKDDFENELEKLQIDVL